MAFVYGQSAWPLCAKGYISSKYKPACTKPPFAYKASILYHACNLDVMLKALTLDSEKHKESTSMSKGGSNAHECRVYNRYIDTREARSN